MKKKLKIDDKLIEDLSMLAKLKFSDEGVKKIKSDLKTMIGFVDVIAGVDTTGVEPLKYMSDEVNILRNDEVNIKTSQKDALKNAPDKDSDYFKVPTILKK